MNTLLDILAGLLAALLRCVDPSVPPVALIAVHLDLSSSRSPICVHHDMCMRLNGVVLCTGERPCSTGCRSLWWEKL